MAVSPGYLLKYKYYMGLSRLLVSVSIDDYSTLAREYQRNEESG